jgi:hypothetical protein
MGIEERIDTLGGTFFIKNNPERGIMIMVSIPLLQAPMTIATATGPLPESMT